MAPSVEISIPSAQTVSPATGRAYTAYTISLRLPLRTYTVARRYNEFRELDAALVRQAGGAAAVPAQLPARHWFASTVGSAALTEERRRGLEAYLRAIADHPDPRWRQCPAWRTFLNLPPATGSAHAASLHSHARFSANASADDPTVWLDTHRELLTALQTAREHLAARNRADGARAQQEAGAAAKKLLVRSGTLVKTLEAGLKSSAGSGEGDWGGRGGDGGGGGGGGGQGEDGQAGGRLGEGELRRRRDLLSAAKKERERLEELQVNIGRKEGLQEDVLQHGEGLRNGDRAGGGIGIGDHNSPGLGPGSSAALFSSSASGRPKVAKAGRVLGKETSRTRELDNRGVAQLQQQMMREQDEDVSALTGAVRHLKDLGMQINEELEVQNDLLNLLDEDVERLDGKVRVARDRVDKIS